VSYARSRDRELSLILEMSVKGGQALALRHQRSDLGILVHVPKRNIWLCKATQPTYKESRCPLTSYSQQYLLTSILPMDSRMQGQANSLHHQPSIELPTAKKTKYLIWGMSLNNRMGEFIAGNNRFGSKGTIRCMKCQTRKGKVYIPSRIQLMG
jgi:hypothetical protein